MIFKRRFKESRTVEQLENGVEFIFIRSYKRKKTLSLRLTKQSQWELRAPVTCPRAEALHFVQSKQSWMEKQTRLRQQCENEQLKENQGWREGQFQYFLGEKLAVIEKSNSSLAIAQSDDGIEFRSSLSQEQRLNHWLSFLKSQAAVVLVERSHHLAQKFGFNSLRQVKTRKMRASWGNCRPSGVITLNLKLIQLPQGLIDSVILHELCHLQQANHSRKFYMLLESIDPVWKQHHQEIKVWGRRVLF